MKKHVITLFIIFPLIAFTQQNSILSTGDWYKIAVEETGIYKVTYDDLESYGIDIDNIDPRYLALYGNPAGMLPESSDDYYYTDIQPIAIQVVGEEDGVFDPEDYILFFGQEPNIWKHNEQTNLFHHITNIYTRKTHYFLTIGIETGKRIQLEQSTTLDLTANIESFDLLIIHELELVNLRKSGKVWLGEDFSDTDSIIFQLDTDNTYFSDSNYFKIALAVNCTEESQFSIKINGELYSTLNVVGSRTIQFDSVCSAGGSDTEITFIYHKPNDSAQAWIDYFEMEFKMFTALLHGDHMSYRTAENVGPGEISDFSLWYENPEDITIWNVTDPVNVKEEELAMSSSHVSYRLPTDSLLEFHVFNGNSFYSAEFAGQIENQNLHGITPPDLLIVTHPAFLVEALQLANFHILEDELSTEVVTTENIYNEFSSGSQDITAIRNFAMYLLEKSGSDSKPNYLLLFGDASYDYLDRIENNTNFVPTFETQESFNPVTSFATDQYFGFDEMNNTGEMQFAVGRIPVSSTEEATIVLNKIQNYYSTNALGNWTNEMMFIADDGDSNHHLNDVEYLNQIVDANTPEMNINKCYLDFFELVQTNEGPRYPEVNETITNKMNDGVFYVNYTGHGGAEQLAFERVLSKDDLLDWTNSHKLPLWVIASVEVAKYDNPDYTSLGESIFLEDGAGAIALISTTRATFAGANLSLNLRILEKLTDHTTQNKLRFGDLMMHTWGTQNDLKWVLLGDPALKVHFPEFNVNTTTLDGINIDEYMDTISPGKLLTFQGQIISKEDGNLQSDFYGTVYLKIFAPEYLRSTIGNQGNPIVDIVVQDSILVEGSAAVNLGEFEILVQLPANYHEGFGNLKLSWYAENGLTDANGYYDQLIFGGEPDAIAEGNEILDQIVVYPTIFTDHLNIELPNNIDKDITYRVYNSIGTEIYSVKSEMAFGEEKIYFPDLA